MKYLCLPGHLSFYLQGIGCHILRNATDVILFNNIEKANFPPVVSNGLILESKNAFSKITRQSHVGSDATSNYLLKNHVSDGRDL